MYVTVIGAGTMGHGIAQVSAMAEHDVVLYDIDDEIVGDGLDAIKSNLDKGVKKGKVDETSVDETLERIEGSTDFQIACEHADLVIEAVPENIELKKSVFDDVEAAVCDDTLIATNTSSLSVTELINDLTCPSRAIGIHFFNPVHIMPLVEVVVAAQTSEETQTQAELFVQDLGKKPVTVNDFPGFASSRLGVTLGVEAIRMVEQGVADAEAIDSVMEVGYNHPMGPLKLTDIVGLDVRLDILEYLHEELGERFRPPQLLKRKVRAGNLGKKTGNGFYEWADGKAVGVTNTS
ncbi:3-hydroxyacyl-CoA dehydrogenase family protein [Natrononativus amylolyticus]|uniref:3-hydroxyacyl-CoA dehydrogenase family protein n=1 Tax=Natrononativus amylolyticus TaxID=2963434 RepID=UPI0020CB8C73|nr:3-hydroxyacyl-CoA dehydrogenase family protein [Natrononativus amylolyticus]